MRATHLRIDPPALQARLRDAREKSGLSQRGLSLLIGAAPGTVANIETGHVQSPSADMLAALAACLGTSVDFLAMGSGEPPAYEAVRAAVARRRVERDEPPSDSDIPPAGDLDVAPKGAA